MGLSRTLAIADEAATQLLHHQTGAMQGVEKRRLCDLAPLVV